MPMLATKTDQEIQQDVFRELRWDSRVDQTEIGVEVDNGIVTLTGTVDSYGKKMAAWEVAHRVIGVLDVADDIQVKISGTLKRTDTEIAQAVRRTLEWDVFVPDQQIRSTVSDGRVTLEGQVNSLAQKRNAERAVRALSGVRAVTEKITVILTNADPNQLRKAIEEALERRAEREADRIRVRVEDGTVTLEGPVRTWHEKDAVLGTVSHAPGVREVIDHLSVSPWE